MVAPSKGNPSKGIQAKASKQRHPSKGIQAKALKQKASKQLDLLSRDPRVFKDLTSRLGNDFALARFNSSMLFS
jgi:hypothetical protein